MKLENYSFVIALLIGISLIVITQNWQFLFAVAILAFCFGLIEASYMIFTGETISKRFWKWNIIAKPWQKIITAIVIIGFAIYTSGHLLFEW